jgi:hypothetical protein
MEAVGDRFEVVADFSAGREALWPVWVGRERVLVEPRRHVAGKAGVGVIPPGAADRFCLLVDGDGADAGLDELDRHAQSGDACTDDRDAGCPDGHRHLEVARSRRGMIIVG